MDKERQPKYREGKWKAREEKQRREKQREGRGRKTHMPEATFFLSNDRVATEMSNKHHVNKS